MGREFDGILRTKVAIEHEGKIAKGVRAIEGGGAPVRRSLRRGHVGRRAPAQALRRHARPLHAAPEVRRPVDAEPKALVSAIDGAYPIGGDVEAGTVLHARDRAAN